LIEAARPGIVSQAGAVPSLDVSEGFANWKAWRRLPACRIADFQSADAAKQVQAADWKSAIQQVGNLRYGAPAAQYRG